MASVLTYSVTGCINKDDNNVGQITGQSFSTHVSIADNMNGPGVGANPEELLLSAAASCYIITLSTLLRNRKIPFWRIELESIAYVESDKGLRLDKIVHHPHIHVEDGINIDTVATLAHHAEHTCMVSSALRGNVKITVTPKVTLEEATQNA